MTIRLTSRSRSALRTGLATVTLSALLFTSAVMPAHAADAPPTDTGITWTESAHQSAAQNVSITADHTTFTVNWEPAAGFTHDYRVTVKQESRIVIARYLKRGPLQLGAPTVVPGTDYTVTIEAMDPWGVNPVADTAITSSPFSLTPEAEPPSPNEPSDPGESPAPGESPLPGANGSGEQTPPGNQPPASPDSPHTPPSSGNETTPAGVPSAPQGVIAGILSDTSVGVNFLPPKNTGNSIVHSYIVRLTPTDNSPSIETTLSEAHELASKYVIVENLIPRKTYKVEVAAKNKAGVGPFATPDYETVTLTPTPNTTLAVSVPTGQKIDALDPSTPTTFTVAGTGYTGEAASKNGVDVVISDTELWRPGIFPIPEFVKQVHIAPAQIVNGAFSTTLTLDLTTDKIDLGREYVIGTLAAGASQLSERRLDEGTEFSFAPAAPKNPVLSLSGKNGVRIVWDRPTDARITSYSVKLYRVADGQEVYANQREVGKALNAVEFFGLKDGVYVATVQSEIQDSSSFFAPPLRSVLVRTGQVTIQTASTPDANMVPAAPKGLNLRLALKDATALEASWLEPSHKPGGKVTNYDIELRGNDQSVRTLKADMNDPLPEFMTIKDLKLGVTYTFTVRAQNAHGWSAWSEPSNPITIPANLDDFAMTPPSEVFASVDKDTSKATVQWIRSGYEPKNGRWLVRIECVTSCPTGFKSFIKDAPTDTDFVVLDNLRPGVYKASLKLVDGARSSAVVVSNNFTVGTPAVMPNPQITVTPTENIDPAAATTFTVTATGYLGSSASRGIYVVVADPSVWAPGKAPTTSALATFAGATWVKPHEIRDGSFTTTVTVPAGTFDRAKSYVVGTMAAHELSISDRSMDAGTAISFMTAPKPQPEPQPEPQPGPGTQPGPEPNPQPGPGTQPGPKPQPGPGTQPQPDPKPQPQPGPGTQPSPKPGPGTPDTSVHVMTNGATVNSFVMGKEASVDLVFTQAKEGSTWKVSLHSTPVELGTIVVKNGKATLRIPAAVAASFTAGDHSLVITPVSDKTAKEIRLPWKVTQAPTQPQKPTPPAVTPPSKVPPTVVPPTVVPPKANAPKVQAPSSADKPSVAKPSDTATPKVTQQASPSGKSASPRLASTGAETAPIALLGLLLLGVGVLTRHSVRRS